MAPHDDGQASLSDELSQAVDAAELEASEQVAEPQEAETIAEALQPPERWNKTLKDRFAELAEIERGRDYQQAWLDYHAEAQGYATKLEMERAQLRKETEGWGSVFQPHQQFLLHNGLSPQDAARKGLGVIAQITANPQQFALDVLKRTNYDFNAHAAQQPYVPQEVQALQQELEQLKRAQQTRELQAQQQQAQQVAQQIRTFAEAKDESGNPKHPHYDAVQDTMATLVWGHKARGEQVPAMDDLYGKALRLHPELEAQDKARADADAAARKAAEARKATNAAKRPTGKHAGKATSAQTLRDELSAAYDKHAA